MATAWTAAGVIYKAQPVALVSHSRMVSLGGAAHGEIALLRCLVNLLQGRELHHASLETLLCLAPTLGEDRVSLRWRAGAS